MQLQKIFHISQGEINYLRVIYTLFCLYIVYISFVTITFKSYLSYEFFRSVLFPLECSDYNPYFHYKYI